ncbi:hypothetical protein [Streptomyces tendae]|uniref:Lipoprotein n=1 Tax=Streptomyces tendae TaxID=1932 RepID=A0ABX6A1W8_STRTE|nr:hypothetical protein [Streptomyces tendae]QER90415.1 hypothetical protein F3L20_32550 [Streptomyces tendae]
MDQPSGRVPAERLRAVAALLLSAGLSVGVLTGCSSGQEGDQAYGSSRVTAQQMVHLLEPSLPEGKAAERRGNGVSQGDKPDRLPAAELLFGDGARAVKGSVQLAWYPVPVPAQLSECPDTASHPYSRCTQRVLPDGARLVLDTSPHAEDKPAGGERYTALPTYQDGKQVSVSAVGAPIGPAPAGRARSSCLSARSSSGTCGGATGLEGVVGLLGEGTT